MPRLGQPTRRVRFAAAGVALGLALSACGPEVGAPTTTLETTSSSSTSSSSSSTTPTSSTTSSSSSTTPTATSTTVDDPAPTTSGADGAPAPAGALVTIGSSAAAATPADRITPPPPTNCERVATAIASRHLVASMQVIVRGASWTDTTVTLEVATRTAAGWRCGATMQARVGRTGMRPLAQRRSGDGTTPSGVFPLATMTAPDGQRFSFFGNSPDPGVTAGTYRRVREGDCFGATPNTPGYGHLRFDTSCPGPDDEYLPRFVNAYTNAALIAANMEPEVSGDAPGEIPYAAAIFLHRHVYVSGTGGPTKPTSGCVSLAQAELTSVLVGLTSGAVFAIGTTDWLISEA